jgi:predicted peroxiredoxin
MNKVIILLTALFMSTGLTVLNAQSDHNPLFVVVTSGDAETQMMAMVLATQSANQDVPVRILLCSDAGKLALRGYDSPTFAPANRSPKQHLTGLMERGVLVEVCGIFLPNRDYTEEDLLDGVRAASPPEVAEFMRQDGVRYFTF